MKLYLPKVFCKMWIIIDGGYVTKLWYEWMISFLLAHSHFPQAGVSFLMKNNVYLREYYPICGWGTGKVWGRVLFLFTQVIWGKNICVTLLERWSNHWCLLSFTYLVLSAPGMECQCKVPLVLIWLLMKKWNFRSKTKIPVLPCVKHRTPHSCFALASKTMNSHIC